MSETFGGDYSRAYDSLYRDKDYEAECDLLERLFEGRGVRSVVDLGCGTGGHALVLSKRGYDVTGIDRSEAMLEQAREKAALAGVEVDFQLGDIRSIDVGKEVDAVIAMFAVLGYQLSNEDVLSTLRAARSAMRPGGMLVFDVWYGPTVLVERPSQRVSVVEDDGEKLIRASSGTLRVSEHICDVTMRVWGCDAGNTVETIEHHSVRFFFPMELRLFLQDAGFELERMGSFPEFDRDPDLSSWNVIAVATAR